MNSLYSRISRAIRNTKIRTRIIFSFLLTSIGFTLLVGYISYENSFSAMQAKIEEYSVQVLNETSKGIYSRIRELNDFANEISYSPMIQAPLQQYLVDNGIINPFHNPDIIIELNNYIFPRTSQLTNIYDIEIFGRNHDYLYGLGYYSLPESKVQHYALLAAEGFGSPMWTYDYLNNYHMLAFAKQIHSLYTREVIGFMFVAVRESTLADLYRDLEIGENLFIINQEGTIISSINGEHSIGIQAAHDSLRAEMDRHTQNGSGSFMHSLSGVPSLITFTHIRGVDWYLVSTTPYTYIVSELRGMFVMILAVCGLAVLLSAVCAIVISRSITLPLDKLVARMRQDDIGKLMAQDEIGELMVQVTDGKNDEISYLQSNYNHLISRIHLLIEQNDKKQLKKREQEIQMLQAQITPHFLFNTLNSLRWVAQMSQANSVSDGIGALSRLLKNTILDAREMVTLAEEIKSVDDYINIQKIRYGTFFSVEYDISPEIARFAILKFILQPIVENSVMHAQESPDQNIHIDITGTKKNGDIEINIRDNGKGMDEQIIINARTSSRSLSGIGISNVRDRIKLCYGEQYGLEIESEPGNGTCVTILIPAWEQNGGEAHA